MDGGLHQCQLWISIIMDKLVLIQFKFLMSLVAYWVHLRVTESQHDSLVIVSVGKIRY